MGNWGVGNSCKFAAIATTVALLIGCGARSELTMGDSGGSDSGANVAGVGGGGAGSGVGGAGAGVPSCTAGSQLTTIFSQPDVTTVAVVADGERVFFTASSLVGGEVYASDRNGDGLMAIATQQQDPWAIAEHGDSVFWIDAATRLMRASKDGSGAAQLLATGPSLQALAVDADHVYFTEGGGGGKIWRSGWNAEAAVVLWDFDVLAPAALALDGSHLFFMTTVPEPSSETQVFKMDKLGGEPVLIGTGGGGVGFGLTMLVADDTSVYWSASEAEVLRVGKDGGEVSSLAQGVTAPSLAQSSGHVYFTTPYDKVRRIWRAEKPTSAAVPIIETGQYNPWSIAVDDDYLFFTSRVTTGPLMRACR